MSQGPQFTKAECIIINEALATYRGNLSRQYREAEGNDLRREAFSKAIRDTQTAQRKLCWTVD